MPDETSTSASNEAKGQDEATKDEASSTAKNESSTVGKAQEAVHEAKGEGSIEDHYPYKGEAQSRIVLHHTTQVERTMEDGSKVNVATDSPREGDIPVKVANQRRMAALDGGVEHGDRRNTVDRREARES